MPVRTFYYVQLHPHLRVLVGPFALNNIYHFSF